MDDTQLGDAQIDGLENTPESDAWDSPKTESTGENTTPEKKNKSNWSKLSEANKALKKQLQEKDSELNQIKEWANSLYENEEDRPFTKKEAKEALSDIQVNESPEKIFLFYQKNPEAVEHADELVETMQEYNVDREKAWKILKTDLPEESKTKKDFSLGNNKPPLKKDLSKVSVTETGDLSPEERSQWRKIHWGVE